MLDIARTPPDLSEMTTIAYDGRILAADSQISDDVIEPSGYRKIHRIGRCLVGAAGAVEEGEEFIQWIRACEDPRQKPRWFKDFSAIVVRPSGRAYAYQERLVPVKCGKITAIGSGRGYALAAMLAGADAVQAVRIAIRLDADSGGFVRQLTLTPGK